VRTSAERKTREPTWSSLVKFRPAALRTEASRMIEKPMINATTGLAVFLLTEISSGTGMGDGDGDGSSIIRRVN
jgi:hypothetical protein